jgi:hypothetical protein
VTRGATAALAGSAVLLLAASSWAQPDIHPKVVASFKGCPSTYPPLVSRVVEVEMGYALADPATEHPDYLLEIECRPDDVSVVVTAHGRKQVPVTFDVSVADGNGGSRVVGLQLAYLLEEVTADWSPPAAPEPAPPPELPPPPPPKPPAELEAKRHPPALQWSLFASAGAVAWGPTPLWGVDGHVGAARAPRRDRRPRALPS